MTKKTIHISEKPTSKDTTKFIDEWVNQGSTSDTFTTHNPNTTKNTTPIKKFTLILPEKLHKKIKIFCVNHNIKINDKLVEIIMREFS